MTGMEAQAAASHKKERSVFRCKSSIAVRFSAIIFLLALTTSFPFFNAVLTISNAASVSLITSTMTLISGSKSKSFLPVVNKFAGAFLFLSGCLIQIFLMVPFNEGV